jgi:hypothetical protein
MGILYLIQPVELIGTNRYKIGCSSKSNIDRVKYGYKKGTRYLHILECDNAFDIEKILKDVFNEKFTLIAGSEYFKGDENEMLELFYNVYKNNKNTEIKNKIQESLYQEKCDKQYECDDEECDDEDESIKEVNTKQDTKKTSKFICENCNYKTNNKYDYNRHINSKKHKNKCVNKQIYKNTYNCLCGKSYTHRSNYYRHIKICNYETNYHVIDNKNNEVQDLLSKQQYDFMKQQQDLLIKQQDDFMKQQHDFMKQQQELLIKQKEESNKKFGFTYKT